MTKLPYSWQIGRKFEWSHIIELSEWYVLAHVRSTYKYMQAVEVARHRLAESAVTQSEGYGNIKFKAVCSWSTSTSSEGDKVQKVYLRRDD